MVNRNRKGGLIVEGGHIDPDTLPAEAYGPTTQCGPECGHVLCEEQWNPRYEPLKGETCPHCGKLAIHESFYGPDRLCLFCVSSKVKRSTT